MLSGVPILFEQSLSVNDAAVLPSLRQKGMPGLHLDLRAHLGKRRNISVHAYPSVCVCGEQKQGILALGRRPGLIARLQ